MRKTLSLALGALMVATGAAPVAAPQTQEELRQLAFVQREMERRERANQARFDALMAENAELRARVEEIASKVASPNQNTTVAEARGAEAGARYAAASLIVDGTPTEQRAADLLAAGDLQNGFAMLEEAAAESTDSAADRWRRLGALAYESDVRRALRAYTEAARLTPNDPETLTRLCTLQARTANIAGARATCLNAVQIAVSDKDRLNALSALDGVYALTGEHEASNQIRPEILRLARAVFEAEPSIDSLSTLLNTLTLELMSDAGRGDIQSVFDRSAQIAALAEEELPGVDPNSRDARLLRSDMILAAGFAYVADPPRMLTAFDESLALLGEIDADYPNHTLTQMRLWDRHNGRGGMYQLLGRTADAIADYNEAERIARALFESDPTDSAKAVILLSTVLMSMDARFSDPSSIEDLRNRLAEVDSELARLSREDRENAMFEIMYGFVHTMVGVIDEARRLDGATLDHNPRVTIEEGRAIMAPHIEAGRIPPEMLPVWTQVEMLIAMLPSAAEAADEDAVAVEIEER